MKRNWPAIFPQLLDSPASRMDSDLSALLDSADEARLPARSTVFRQGDQCSNYLLVISRQLKELEQRGMVSLQRGSLTVLDRPGLDKLAGG